LDLDISEIVGSGFEPTTDLKGVPLLCDQLCALDDDGLERVLGLGMLLLELYSSRTNWESAMDRAS
jgi:hypothetical protein